MKHSLFQSFFLGGFECSCHRNSSRRRLDLLEITCHTKHAAADFRRLKEQGITTARSGIRWHLIEKRPYHYDFASVLPLICEAKRSGIQMIWDLCHYGWPDDLDIFSVEFVDRFVQLTRAFTHLLINETGTTPFLTPINEISYFSWAAGDVGRIFPYAHGRGVELKVQLVRASIAAIEAIWEIAPDARIFSVEPVIHIVPRPDHPEERQAVHDYCMAQYQAWYMLAGRIFPELGGQEKYLDTIGVNFYSINQWIHKGANLGQRNPLYKPFRQILAEVYERYQKPLFVAETGTEGDRRPGWLRYVGREVRAALRQNIPVEGICLYPILNHPGWDDDRYCPNGLWDYADERGERAIYQPYAAELNRQQRIFARIRRTAPAAPVRFAKERPPDQASHAICLFTDSLEPSGLGEHMLTLATELRRHHTILFVCPPTKRGEALLARAKMLGCTALPLPLEDEPRVYHTLADRLQQMQIRVFHCHAGIGWEGHHGVFTARRAGVPVVLRTEHLPYLLTDPHQRAAYQRLSRDVDHFIFVSAEARRTHLAAGVPGEKSSLIQNGILEPIVYLKGWNIRREFGLPARAKVLITPARMTPQKGHRYLVEAAPEILAAEPNTYFLWAGDGPEEPVLRQQIAESGIDPAHIRFLGWRTDVHRLIAGSNLFVLPSLFEGLPLTVLEALALGVPVVGTCVCGTSEAIEDGVSGRLVKPGDSKALASAIVCALRNPALRTEWAQAGQTRFKKFFTAERMGQDTVALYRRMLQQEVA